MKFNTELTIQDPIGSWAAESLPKHLLDMIGLHVTSYIGTLSIRHRLAWHTFYQDITVNRVFKANDFMDDFENAYKRLNKRVNVIESIAEYSRIVIARHWRNVELCPAFDGIDYVSDVELRVMDTWCKLMYPMLLRPNPLINPHDANSISKSEYINKTFHRDLVDTVPLDTTTMAIIDFLNKYAESMMGDILKILPAYVLSESDMVKMMELQLLWDPNGNHSISSNFQLIVDALTLSNVSVQHVYSTKHLQTCPVPS